MINDMEVYCKNKGCPWKGVLNDLNNHIQNCIFDSTRIPDNVKYYIDNLDKKESNPKFNVHDEDTTDKYLNFNKNASLKARLFNKNSQLIISSLNNNSNGNNNYNDILGNKDDILDQMLNIDQNNNYNNQKSNANSLIGSKILNNNIHDLNTNTNNTLNANSQHNNILKNNSNVINNLNYYSRSNNEFQNNMTYAGNSGDYNLLKSKININDFSLFNKNEQASTLSQHSKTSSVYGDDLVANEDLINNINDFNSGNKQKIIKRKTEKKPPQFLKKKRRNETQRGTSEF